jgi:hypothetical protein
LEASELVEALRGKNGGDVVGEAADVLIVLMSITEDRGIRWDSLLKHAEAKVVLTLQKHKRSDTDTVCCTDPPATPKPGKTCDPKECSRWTPYNPHCCDGCPVPPKLTPEAIRDIIGRSGKDSAELDARLRRTFTAPDGVVLTTGTASERGSTSSIAPPCVCAETSARNCPEHSEPAPLAQAGSCETCDQLRHALEREHALRVEAEERVGKFESALKYIAASAHDAEALKLTWVMIEGFATSALADEARAVLGRVRP